MASEQARVRGHRYVGVEHLMLAILLEGASLAVEALQERVPIPQAVADLEKHMSTQSYGVRPAGDDSRD